MPQLKELDSDINSINSDFASSCWMSIVHLHRVQTAKEIRREQTLNASTPVRGNVNYIQKPLYMGCCNVKAHSASRNVMDKARNGIEICWPYATLGGFG